MAFWTDGGKAGANDPKRNFRFKVEIGGFANSDDGDNQSTVWWAKKVQKPNWTTAESKHVFMGHTFYWPGKTEWQEITLTLVDPVSPNAMGILGDIVEKSGYDIPVKSEPFKTQSKSKSAVNLGPVVITQINANDEAVEKWTLHNPFIKKVSFSDLDYENDDLTTIDLGIRYDWATCQTGQALEGKGFFAPNGPWNS